VRNELFRIELRRGPGIVAAALTLILFWVALRRYGPILTWMDATSAIGASTQLCGPVAAGVAAHCGSRALRRRTALQRRLAARAELASTGSELAGYAVWVVGAWLVAGAVTLVAARHNCHWGHPNVVWMLASGAGLVAEIAVGYFFGRLVPMLITPAVVTVVLFLGTGLLLGHVNAWWYFLSPLNSQLWLPFDDLRTGNFILQATFLTSVAVAAGAAASVRLARSERAGLLALGLALVVSVAAAAGLAAGDGRFWTINTHIEWQCSGHNPTVCVHPAFVAMQAQLEQQLDAVAARTAGTPFQVERFEQRPRGIGGEPTPGAVAFAMDVPVAVALSDTALAATVSLLNADSCQTAGPKRSSARVEQAVVEWVSGQSVLGPDQSMPDPAADALVSDFNSLSDQAKRGWLTRHAEAIRSCSFGLTERR
jgi:hypothetical protein